METINTAPITARSNIANKVNNTHLPVTMPLLPLFEVISNSVHAIAEAKKAQLLKGKGEVRITVIRQGNPKTLEGLEEVENYPIRSLSVWDNGIGLDDDNLGSFTETDSDHKVDIGGKGVGRFVCLKAFTSIQVESNYFTKNGWRKRNFEFKNTKEGFDNYSDVDSKSTRAGTTVTLNLIRTNYQKNAPKSTLEIARDIIDHFQLYFINGNAPKLTLFNQNGDSVDVNNVFSTEFESKIEKQDFEFAEEEFTLILIKSMKAQSHRLHYCAHNRTVKKEALHTLIPDLGKYSLQGANGSFYYQAFVVGDVLSKWVNQERTKFDFPDDDEDEEADEKLTMRGLRANAVETIEFMLRDYLSDVRERKLEVYRPRINDELPQYRSIVSHRPEAVKRLQPNLPKEKLDVELYKIESNWKVEMMERSSVFFTEDKDITKLPVYQQKYERLIDEFNEIGKTDLARYVVHRRTVIDLLEKFIGMTEEGKFVSEELIHTIFFPIRSTSDDIPHEKQNLWLIDERLTYHSFLASDKRFDQIDHIEVDDDDRSDLLIYTDAFAFVDKEERPKYSSFTIVEFKKPQRDDYKDFDEEENPFEQTEKYIKRLREGKVKDRTGRMIAVDKGTAFYVHIVCDISKKLEAILEDREFVRTPDGMGYYRFKSQYYSAYIEVIPFEKVLHDAKLRNRILFEKLNIA